MKHASACPGGPDGSVDIAGAVKNRGYDKA